MQIVFKRPIENGNDIVGKYSRNDAKERDINFTFSVRLFNIAFLSAYRHHKKTHLTHFLLFHAIPSALKHTHILLFILFVLTLLLLRAFSGYVYKCVQQNNNMLAHETMCGILLLTRMIKQRNCRHKPNTPSYRAHKKQYNESTCNSQVTRFVVYRFVEVCVCVRACAWNCPISYAECIPRRAENKW